MGRGRRVLSRGQWSNRSLVATQVSLAGALVAVGAAAFGHPWSAALFGAVAAAVAVGASGVATRVSAAAAWWAPPPPATRTTEPRRLRDLDRRQRVGVGLLLVLVVLTGVHVVQDLVARDAIVVGDEALIAFFAHDAPQDAPLIGKVTSAVLYGNLTQPHNPGPAESWTLAPFVLALGTSVGSWVYAYVLNLGVALASAWAGFRRGGPRSGLMVLAACLMMFALTAPGGISSVLNTRIVVMPLFAGLVVAAMVVLGDTALLALAVLLATYVIQTHVGYAPVAAAGLATALAAVGWHYAREDRPRAVRNHLLWALGLAAVCWAPSLYDQIFRSGNLGALLTVELPRSGPARAADAVATILNPRVIFLHRGELTAIHYQWPSPGVAVLLLLGVGWLVVRRRRQLAAYQGLLALGAACLAAAAITAALTPPTDTGGEHFYWIRAVSCFLVLLVLMIATPPSSGAGDEMAHRYGWLGWTVVVIAAVAPLWVPKQFSATDERAMTAVHDLLPAVITATEGPRPVALAHQGYWPAISVADGLVTELENRSIPVVQIDDATTLEGFTTLVVTHGPNRLGTPLAASVPSDGAGDPGVDDSDAPRAVVAWARAHGPLRLAGPGVLHLDAVLDGTSQRVCLSRHLEDPSTLLEMDPTVVADLYFQQQVITPDLPLDLDLAVSAWASTWPTELRVAPPAPPGQDADELILSESSC